MRFVDKLHFLAVDENDLETLSNEVKMDYSEYVNQTKKAFSRINLGSLNFVYQTKKQKDGSLILSWKKHIMAENIKVGVLTRVSHLCHMFPPPQTPLTGWPGQWQRGFVLWCQWASVSTSSTFDFMIQNLRFFVCGIDWRLLFSSFNSAQ